jgi:hypothetical protein
VSARRRPGARACPISPSSQALALLALLALLAGCAPAAPPVSEQGKARCLQQRAGGPSGFARDQAYRRCLATIEAVLAEERRSAERLQAAAQQRQELIRQARQRCLDRREQITGLMSSLRRAEAELAAVKIEAYTPPPPPPPWDEARESRYRQEDQELDRQRHEAALAAWQSRVAGRRAGWEAGRRQRQEQAQQRLDRTAAELRALAPDLFTGPSSIEFNPAVARQVRSCDPTL